MSIPTMEEMLKAGVHFGHQASHWHPKMEPFIYTTRNGMHIFDLKKTQAKLEEAREYVQNVVAKGGDVLFVGTKSQAQPLIEQYAQQAGMPYIKSRWIGGMLTNFDEVKKSIKLYLDLNKQKEAGEWKKYTKKEQIGLQKQVDKLARSVSGLTSVTKLPAAIFIVDIRKEKTALLEANVVNIPVIAICDTNVNPDKVTKVIPANDDASKGVEMLISVIAEACATGAKKRQLIPTPVKKGGNKPVAKTAIAKADVPKKVEAAKKESK